MKSAVVIDADWPGDEVVLVLDGPAEAMALRQHLDGVETGQVGGRLVALMDRVAFRVLCRYVAAACDRVRLDAADGPALRHLRARLDTLTRHLAAARDDDRSGDPLPGTPMHAAMADDLAEAGR